jgi:F0F1-type ATP synthase assembly protein I
MEKNLAPTTSTTPNGGDSKPADFDQQVAAAKQNFIASAMNMSWQLAVVVLVPIIGGFKLDEHLHMAPLLTIVGFLVAMGGMALVLWQQLQRLSPVPKLKGNSK